MVSHEVGVLGEVDGLHGEAAEALPPVDGLILGGGGAAAAGLGAPLAIHGVCSAWPPLECRRVDTPVFCSMVFVPALIGSPISRPEPLPNRPRFFL